MSEARKAVPLATLEADVHLVADDPEKRPFANDRKPMHFIGVDDFGIAMRI